MRKIAVLCALILWNVAANAAEKNEMGNAAPPKIAVMLSSDARRISAGQYRFTLNVSPRQELKSARILVARSAKNDFQNAAWQQIAMQDSPLNAQSIGNSMTFRECSVPVGTAGQKFLAVKAEIEVAGSGQRLVSNTIELPSIKVWTLENGDGSRRIYAQPSEPGAQVQVFVARLAAPNAQNVKWENVPLTPPDARLWQNHSADAPASDKAAPYFAAYAEMIFPGQPASKVQSPQIFWNGLPWPSDKTKIEGNICPLHGSKEGVIPIIYGLPGAGAPRDAKFAGCIVGPGSATWYCRQCDRDWGDEMKKLR